MIPEQEEQRPRQVAIRSEAALQIQVLGQDMMNGQLSQLQRFNVPVGHSAGQTAGKKRTILDLNGDHDGKKEKSEQSAPGYISPGADLLFSLWVFGLNL